MAQYPFRISVVPTVADLSFQELRHDSRGAGAVDGDNLVPGADGLIGRIVFKDRKPAVAVIQRQRQEFSQEIIVSGLGHTWQEHGVTVTNLCIQQQDQAQEFLSGHRLVDRPVEAVKKFLHGYPRSIPVKSRVDQLQVLSES